MGRGRWALADRPAEPQLKRSREESLPSLTEPAVADRIAVPVHLRSWPTPAQRIQVLDFDELAIVLLTGDLGIWRTIVLPAAALERLMRRNEYVNGERLMATDRLLADVDNRGGRDLTDEASQSLGSL